MARRRRCRGKRLGGPWHDCRAYEHFAAAIETYDIGQLWHRGFFCWLHSRLAGEKPLDPWHHYRHDFNDFGSVNGHPASGYFLAECRDFHPNKHDWCLFWCPNGAVKNSNSRFPAAKSCTSEEILSERSTA